MNGYGKTTRLLITALVVVLGTFYLASDYLGTDVAAQPRHLVWLAQALLGIMLGAVVLLGIFKLIGKLYDALVDRQSRDDDSSSSE